MAKEACENCGITGPEVKFRRMNTNHADDRFNFLRLCPQCDGIQRAKNKYKEQMQRDLQDMRRKEEI